MGNNAGNFAGCAVGSASAVLGVPAAAAGCSALLAVPVAGFPLAAACFVGVPAAGFVGGALGANACKEAAMGGGGDPPPEGDPPPDDDPNARRKRQYGKRYQGAKGQRQGGIGRGRTGTRPRARSDFIEFDVLDVNGDGFLSNDDIPSRMTDERLKSVVLGLIMYLGAIGTDGDGRISRAELGVFRDAVRTDGGSLQMIYNMMDKNKDGRLTPNEMIEMTGECAAFGSKTDPFDACSQTMALLDKQRKGWVDMRDVQSFYDSQPKPPPATGSFGVWRYQAPNDLVQVMLQSSRTG